MIHLVGSFHREDNKKISHLVLEEGDRDRLIEVFDRLINTGLNVFRSFDMITMPYLPRSQKIGG